MMIGLTAIGIKYDTCESIGGATVYTGVRIANAQYQGLEFAYVRVRNVANDPNLMSIAFETYFMPLKEEVMDDPTLIIGKASDLSTSQK